MKLSIVLGALALTTGTALGGAIVTHEDSFLAFGATMPYGSGNSNSNFTIARNSDTFGDIEIGLKAKERYVGDLTTNGAGRYYAPAGSPTNDGISSWNIDFAFALSQNAIPANYSLILSVDFDAGFGTQSWVTLDITQTLQNFFLNTSSGGDSQNLNFSFWSTSTSGLFNRELDATNYMAFDANAFGEYDINLSLRDAAGAMLAESAIVVEVVPTPGSMALLGLGGLAAVRRRRRR
ncbi:MAG: PEP-CTERM sorting domain-containing protein [Phycisphaerales bacterium]|nr:PEP-CTERM sorting domain-containing protein [Phycisphaerales bacterium]